MVGPSSTYGISDGRRQVNDAGVRPVVLCSLRHHARIPSSRLHGGRPQSVGMIRLDNVLDSRVAGISDSNLKPRTDAAHSINPFSSALRAAADKAHFKILVKHSTGQNNRESRCASREEKAVFGRTVAGLYPTGWVVSQGN